MTPHQTKFHAALVAAYAELFSSDPRFAPAAANMTPAALADKMIAAAIAGTANTTGPGFRMACNACGIAHTRKAIDAFLGVAAPVKAAAAAKPRKVSSTVLNNIQSAMTGVFQIDYSHGLICLRYADGSTEAGKIEPPKWAEIQDNPFAIVSHVQSQRVPANS